MSSWRRSRTQLNDGDLASPAYTWDEDPLLPESTSRSWYPTASPSYQIVSKNDHELTTISRPSLTQRKTETTIDGDEVSLLNTHESASNQTRSRTWRMQRKYSGWKVGLMLSSCCTGAVFLLNLILAVWAASTFGTVNGYGVLVSGSCARTKTASTWIHLGINVLSTLLLSASNYCMQILTAPTRPEIDRAHAKAKWLDIGVPSVRNLRWIGWDRVCIWMLLALSSLPLHLLYNSAVYDTLTANEYVVWGGSEQIQSWTNYTKGIAYQSYSIPAQASKLLRLAQQGNLTRLEAGECITAYGHNFVSDRRDVIIILNDTGTQPTDKMFLIGTQHPKYDSASWICSNIHHEGPCTASLALPTADNWIYFASQQINSPIEYCLSQETTEHCQLQFSVTIMAIVIIANFVKLLCMVYTVSNHKIATIVTVGDAVSSFLQNPDHTTTNRCTFSKRSVVDDQKWHRPLPGRNYEAVPPEPQPWDCKRGRWFQSASKTRWAFCYVLCIVTITIGAILEGQGRNGLSNAGITPNLKNLWNLGFGAVTASALVGVHSLGIVGNTLLANAPQVILSFLYLSYNSIFTCQLLSQEWTSYTQKRKALRVTSPEASQRSTYFLQLPYTYSVPLLVFSALLHWLVSQSIFLAQINVYDEAGLLDENGTISRCGYSCIAIICVLTVGSILIAAGFLNGFRRYPGGIPLAATCSVAISAACHPPAKDTNAAFKEVQYGEVEMTGGVRHCTFTSHPVTAPTAGELYT